MVCVTVARARVDPRDRVVLRVRDPYRALADRDARWAPVRPRSSRSRPPRSPGRCESRCCPSASATQTPPAPAGDRARARCRPRSSRSPRGSWHPPVPRRRRRVRPRPRHSRSPWGSRPAGRIRRCWAQPHGLHHRPKAGIEPHAAWSGGCHLSRRPAGSAASPATLTSGRGRADDSPGAWRDLRDRVVIPVRDPDVSGAGRDVGGPHAGRDRVDEPVGLRVDHGQRVPGRAFGVGRLIACGENGGRPRRRAESRRRCRSGRRRGARLRHRRPTGRRRGGASSAGSCREDRLLEAPAARGPARARARSANARRASR